jgi:hypothetical protein
MTKLRAVAHLSISGSGWTESQKLTWTSPVENVRDKRDKSRCEADGRVNSGATPNKMSAKSAISAISPPVGSLLAGNCEAKWPDGPLRAGGVGRSWGHVSITVPNVRRSSIFVASISMAQRMPQRHDLPRCGTLARMLVII